MFSKESLEKARTIGQQTRQENRKHQLELINASVDMLLQEQGQQPLPHWAHGHIAKARKGRVTSLIALKCADCVCWERKEIEKCELVGCPLWSLRPYQSHAEDTAGESPPETECKLIQCLRAGQRSGSS